MNRTTHSLALTTLAAITLLTNIAPAKAQGLDPLLDTTAYSLSVRSGGWDRPNYFPLGVLFPRDRGELISYGFDFTERAVSPLISPSGDNITMEWFAARHKTAAPPPSDADHLGLFTASWAWHMMPMDTNQPGYGTFTKSRSYFDPSVRRFMLSSDAALSRIYGAPARPAMMWSLDNEWEGELDYSAAAQAGFIEWLKASYATLPALNKVWGTEYHDWKDIVPPKIEPVISRPAAWLDWHAYQDDFFTRFTADRYRAIFNADPQHRGIAQKTTQQSFDLPEVGKARVLDPAQFCELTRPLGGWYGVDIYDAGDLYEYQVNFASQCIRPSGSTGSGRLFLTETNNHGGPGKEFANSIWRSLGNGTKAYDFFCFGMPGATGDSDVYGLTAPNTLLRDKAPYAVRFTYGVRRMESFLAKSRPSPAAHRVAMLLNRRDMLLADNTPGNMWAGPTNNRERVYSELRQAGFWVDVIPYTKLNASFLKQYDALIVVGGDHLTSDECGQVAGYVKNGGVLVADMLAGYYNERHQAAHGLDPVLGASVTTFATDANAKVSLQSVSGFLHGHDIATVHQGEAETIEKADGGAPIAFKNTYGQGAAIYIATHLGRMEGDSTGQWLTSLLAKANVHPAYSTTAGAQDTAALRVEQPFTDGANTALVIANVKDTGHTATTLRLSLPAGPWKSAFWSPAENEGLQPVKVQRLTGGQYAVDLPAFQTAGMLLLLNNHAPLISVPEIVTQKRGIDGHLPALTPDTSTKIMVTVFNPSPVATKPGLLKTRALRGWNVTPAIIHTPAIAPYGSCRVAVTVTPPATGLLPYTERMYPVNFRWSNGKTDQAVTTTPVGIDIDNARCPWLLSDNSTYPADFPRKLKTGATYRYVDAKAGKVSDPADGSPQTGTALQSNYSRWLMDSESANFEAPHFPTATIDFDLKDAYPLHAVNLLSSEFGGYPTRLDVSISNDGIHFEPAGSAVPEGEPGSGKWLMVDTLDEKSARYVRLTVALQGGGGRINEVEIWGYPKR